MKKYLVLIFTMTLLPFISMAADMKFQKKAAEKVWSMRPDLFNPQREIPDSLKDHFSAVVIGQYDFVDADYHAHDGIRGVESRSNRFSFTRKMVKLLDQKAVEEFSKHEFGGSATVKARYRRSMAEIKTTFGARIHKPDGTVQDVDMSKAFDITEGKKDNEVLKQKIDIPGLQPGDVLEYFTYSEDQTIEFDLPALRLMLADKYPVLESVIEGVFSPKLTVEFRGYNGAPEIECSVNDKGRNTAWLHVSDIPAITDRHYVNKIREVPFYDFYMLNNTSPYRFYPKFMRTGGLYQNPLAGTIFRDISLVVAASNYDSSPLPGKIRKIIKNYRKNNPEASNDQLIDMAWAAANYANLTDRDGEVSDFWLALMMCDILKKEKLYDNAGVGFINSANDVPTEEIVNWRQPDFGMLVGDKLFLSTEFNCFLPGEMSPIYQGQVSASYPGDRDKLWNFTMPTIVTTPVSKAGDNRFVVTSTITLGEDNDATVENQLSLTGAMKHLASPFTDYSEWIASQEDYLGIEPSKRYKPKESDGQKKTERINEAMKELYADIFTGENPDISEVKITSRGVTPDASSFEMSFNAKTPEVYSMAGDELIFKIGCFAGKQERMEDNERDRSTNISILAASQDNCNIVVNIPDGYEADDASIAALANNVKTPIGTYVTSAKKSEDGKSVTVASRFRLNHPTLGPAAWPEILKLTDAKSAFNDAILILRKK